MLRSLNSKTQNLNNLLLIFLPKSHFSHSIQPHVQPYYSMRKKQFQQSKIKSQERRINFCTEEGTKNFFERYPNVQTKNLFFGNKNIKLSSVGIGTYKGSLSQQDDIAQFNAIVDTVLSGANVIDTCSNFRGGRSEISIGYALNYLFSKKKFQRNQLFLMSKAGYIRQKIPQQLSNQILNDHCVHPTYLQKSLNQSLDNMGVQALDVFYLNNFAESQLKELGQDKWENRLAKAFEFMQKARKEKKIQYYGLSSWQAFRVSPQSPSHVNLKKISEIASKVGGAGNGFKFIQLPINIMMPQAFADKTQQYGSFLQAAQILKINVVSNSPLLNGTLINTPLPTNKLSCRYNGAKHLQLIRSIPSPALVCTVIGHKTNRHTKKNLQALNVPLLNEEEWFELFVPNQSTTIAAGNLK